MIAAVSIGGIAVYIILVGFVGEFLEPNERGKAWLWPFVMLIGLGAALGARLKQERKGG